MRNPQQKIGVTIAGVDASEIVFAIHVRLNRVSVVTVAYRVEAELQKMAAPGPAQIVDPFQRRFRIGLEVEGVGVRIPGGDAGF